MQRNNLVIITTEPHKKILPVLSYRQLTVIMARIVYAKTYSGGEVALQLWSLQLLILIHVQLDIIVPVLFLTFHHDRFLLSTARFDSEFQNWRVFVRHC